MFDMNLYENLNEKQKEAITTRDQFVRIIAGAGSGKTRVLTTRIAYLIEEIGVPENRIIGFTFTNKAAEEMVTRLKKILGRDSIATRLSTFHAFGARFLREEIKILNRSQGFIIYDEEDTKALIRNICVERGHEKRGDVSKEAISFIGAQKEKGLDAFTYKVRPFGFVNEEELVKIWQIYETRLKDMGCLDFSDLINKTLLILEDYPTIRQKWQNRYDHILVDEFQDTNDIQYKLIRLLLVKQTGLYVVGDPDQTIYTWRGANERIIINLELDFAGTKTIILNQNYRSTQQILNAANTLIAHNKNRVPKDLFTANQEGDPVLVNYADSDVGEVNWIYEQIVSMKLNVPDFSFRQVAILLRANYLTLPFERHFLHKGVNYRIYGGIRFFQRREVKDVLAYLRLLLNERDDISFERIINVPRRGVGDVALENLKIAALENEYSLLQAIRFVDDLKLSVKTLESLKNLTKMIDDTRAKLDNKNLNFGAVIRDYVKEVGYFDFIDTEKDEEKQEVMRGNVYVLIEDIVDFNNQYPSATFGDYLENASLHSAQDDVEEGEYITLMTVHMAKGLEYDYVFVAGMMEGVFPNQRAIMEAGHAGEEEERRLCYVAFTRAKKKLYVTANTSYNFAIGATGRASRFINEAGLEPPRTKVYHEKYGTPTRPPHPYKQIDAPRYQKDSGFDYASDFPYAVNDIVEHTTFGSGMVIAIFPAQTVIEVKFDSGEIKKLIATHKAIKKV